MVALGSDVSLREDILKQPRVFYPTWVEWSAVNRDQVEKFIARGSAGSSNIFTVPTGLTFWITSANMSGGSSTGSSYEVLLRITSSQRTLATFEGSGTAAQTFSMTYPMPIRVEQNETIDLLVQSPNVRASASIQGFLEPRQISGRGI